MMFAGLNRFVESFLKEVDLMISEESTVTDLEKSCRICAGKFISFLESVESQALTLKEDKEIYNDVSVFASKVGDIAIEEQRKFK